MRAAVEPPAPAGSNGVVAGGNADTALGVRRSTTSERGSLLVILLIAGLIGLRLVALAASLPDDDSRGVPAFRGDAKRYHEIAGESGVPYVDFAVEYPPVTYALIEAIDGDDVRSTMRRLGIVAFALDIATFAAVAYGWGRRAGIAYLVLGLPFLYLPFTYFRIDLLAVALALWGLVLVRRRAQLSGGVLLALAVFAKLWPLAVLPALLVQRRARAVAAVVVTGVIGCLTWFATAGTGGFEQVLTFRGARGWQIESVIGGAIRVFTGESPRIESGAVRFGNAPLWTTLASAILVLGVVGWIWWRTSRTPQNEGLVYGVAPLVAVTTFMVCSPLLSPQFLIWIAPFAAICWAYGERALAWITGWAIVLTMVLTQSYSELTRAEAVGHGVLMIRNATLIALVVVGLVAIKRETEPSARDPQVMSSMR